MPTKTTTKTAARKPSTARKAVKAAVVVEPKRKEPKSVKELPAKTSRTSAPASTKTRAAHPPPAPKAHVEPAETPKPAPKPAMETVSLIEEKKPRLKRADGAGARKTLFLPPISRIRATPEPPATPIAPVVPPKAEPTEVAPAKDAAAPVTASPAAEPEVEQKIIHIKPPIIVKELATQLG